MSFFFIIGILVLFFTLAVLGVVLNFFFTVLRGFVSLKDILPWNRKKAKSAYTSSGGTYHQPAKKTRTFDKSQAEEIDYEEIN
ncbi:MAG: hypothetical protein J6W49_06575 [Paludibacteraceae bacterium]|nr:hypothetical protein [Paludibacteraceae bacterium]MBP5136752.1 hypothetical protein [Paludibacteraceae bacterium]MBP5743083.1 hypothetical protein [Paludibacteraceae bacterium]